MALASLWETGCKNAGMKARKFIGRLFRWSMIWVMVIGQI